MDKSDGIKEIDMTFVSNYPFKILIALIFLSMVIAISGCSDSNSTASDDRVQRGFTLKVTVLNGSLPAARRTVILRADKTDLSGESIPNSDLHETLVSDSEGKCEWEFSYRLNSSEQVITEARVEEDGHVSSETSTFSWNGPTTKAAVIMLH